MLLVSSAQFHVELTPVAEAPGTHPVQGAVPISPCLPHCAPSVRREEAPGSGSLESGLVTPDLEWDPRAVMGSWSLAPRMGSRNLVLFSKLGRKLWEPRVRPQPWALSGRSR